jgi:hypothetical protein
MRHLLTSMGFTIFCVTQAACGQDAPAWQAKDLNPVTFQPAPRHEPVTLVKDGQPAASIVACERTDAAQMLQRFIRAATGATLPITTSATADVAIVLGDCPAAAAAGLESAKLPPEGLAIKTAPGRVFIVGRNDGKDANGLEWGVYEFLERYVGVRWYFPPAVENGPDIGQDIPKRNKLVVPAVWLEDAPVFRMRELWPACANSWAGTGVSMGPLQRFNRSANSWPVQLVVHSPNWSKRPEIVKDRPEVFQMKKDGSRQHEVLCYGNARTLETYLEGIQAFLDKKPSYVPITANRAITVSPADVELACYCPDCRKLWDDNGGASGGASKIMATFVDKLAIEVKKRWPNEGFTIIFLPYLNYTAAPDGFKFPDNVEVQICGMPGMACLKEPAIRDGEQANIDKWQVISGRKVQTWLYDCWPANKTKAAYQYPHVVRDFYKANRDKVIGSFVNGEYNHWPRQHISLYCWQKVLWNPDYNVDAAMDAFCTRMFGPASATMRQLLALQTDGWEKSKWPGGRFSPKGIYEVSFPPATVETMRKLIAKAQAEAKADTLVTTRLNYYYEGGLKDFFTEADAMSGKGLKPLLVQKVGENPVIDGQLDDPAWARATPVSFVQATGKEQGQPPKYPTSVQALWTSEGVTFGFRMSEPTPDLLETKNGGHDNGEIWWDDCIELFLDVTGKREGQYYQFIINPDGNYWDSKGGDTTWECKGVQMKTFRGKDFWSMEVFVPYAAFPEGLKPGSVSSAAWAGNFTRHRVADQGPNSTKPKQAGSVAEYQRMNTLGSAVSANQADFSPIRFIE